MSIDEDVLNLLNQTLGHTDMSAESSMENTRGWDSLSFINIVVALETEFGVNFSTLEAASLTSYSSIIDALNKKLPSK